MCIGSEHEQQIERYPSTKHIGPPRKYGLFLFSITLCLVMQKVCHNDLRPQNPSSIVHVGGGWICNHLQIPFIPDIL